MEKKVKRVTMPDRNPDPITDEPGAHPVGVGVGATGGGVAGAAIGSVAGPIGTAVGAAIGAVAGGLAGKAVAEQIDPTVEDAYWRENYQSRPYVDQDAEYDTYRPAYRYGWESSGRYADRPFEEVEPNLANDWKTARGTSTLEWSDAKAAARDAWERTKRAVKPR